MTGLMLVASTLTWILGLGSIGLWVGCYYECPTGKNTDFNYYVAVWTGAVAFFTGLFHMVFCCSHRSRPNKLIVRIAAFCSYVLTPCVIICTVLSGYLSWREWDTEQKYKDEVAKGNNPDKLEGNFVTGIGLFAGMAIVGLFLFVLTVFLNCYHCCGGFDYNVEEDEIPIESQPEVSQRLGYNNIPLPQYKREAGTYHDHRRDGNYHDHRRDGNHHDHRRDGNHHDHRRDYNVRYGNAALTDHVRANFNNAYPPPYQTRPPNYERHARPHRAPQPPQNAQFAMPRETGLNWATQRRGAYY